MAEIVSVTSEALEAQIRNLFPSQRGFGEDLQASNVITPIIDLTAAAQGTQVPEILQTAINFGGATAFDISAGNTETIAGTGFWRVTATLLLDPTSTNPGEGIISQTDGLSSKTVIRFKSNNEPDPTIFLKFIDLVFFNAAGISTVINAIALANWSGSYRQIADVNGNLVNPVGFSPQ